jgi:hypothetical protein
MAEGAAEQHEGIGCGRLRGQVGSGSAARQRMGRRGRGDISCAEEDRQFWRGPTFVFITEVLRQNDKTNRLRTCWRFCGMLPSRDSDMRQAKKN